MSNVKSYIENWKKSDVLAGGGQGTTVKATNIQDVNMVSAVKILNRQNEIERRARMQRETVALTTLSHQGLPKVLDSNTEFWQDLNYKLFIATEFIPGDTLAKFNFLELSVTEKAKLIIRISEIIDYCHQRGIVHRDIKPDNVILRSNSIEDPVVIDFGISFNFNDSEDDSLTPGFQHLGNRFLILPEQKVGEVDKRDFRSDITCIVGLFFFFLTGIQPTVIIDQYNQSPHQRNLAKDIINNLPKHQKDKVNNIFDVGFNQLIDKRWQTIKSLITQLKDLIDSEPIALINAKEKIEYIKMKSQTQSLVDNKMLFAILNKVDRFCNDTMIEIIEELGNDWAYNQSGNLSLGANYSNQFELFNKFNQSITTSTMIVATYNGNELVIKLLEESHIVEILRQPARNDINWIQFKEAIKKHFINVIANQM